MNSEEPENSIKNNEESKKKKIFRKSWIFRDRSSSQFEPHDLISHEEEFEQSQDSNESKKNNKTPGTIKRKVERKLFNNKDEAIIRPVKSSPNLDRPSSSPSLHAELDIEKLYQEGLVHQMYEIIQKCNIQVKVNEDEVTFEDNNFFSSQDCNILKKASKKIFEKMNENDITPGLDFTEKFYLTLFNLRPDFRAIFLLHPPEEFHIHPKEKSNQTSLQSNDNSTLKTNQPNQPNDLSKSTLIPNYAYKKREEEENMNELELEMKSPESLGLEQLHFVVLNKALIGLVKLQTELLNSQSVFSKKRLCSCIVKRDSFEPVLMAFITALKHRLKNVWSRELEILWIRSYSRLWVVISSVRTSSHDKSHCIIS